jgi:hypothetical protein
MLRKIVSGRQTGTDRAELDWAISRGVRRGGWCPKGRRAEDGPHSGLLLPPGDRIGELPGRTERNVVDSDGTAIFTLKSELSGGSKRTGNFARKYGKSLLHLHPGIENPGEALAVFVRANGIEVLNAAGPRLSGAPGIEEFVKATLGAAKKVFTEGGFRSKLAFQ